MWSFGRGSFTWKFEQKGARKCEVWTKAEKVVSKEKLVRGSLTHKYEQKAVRKCGLIKGVVIGERFIYIETWTKGLTYTLNMRQVVRFIYIQNPDRRFYWNVVLKKKWILMSGSVTRKYEHRGLCKCGLKREVVIGRGSFSRKYEQRDSWKCGLKREIVTGERFYLHGNIWREKFTDMNRILRKDDHI